MSSKSKQETEQITSVVRCKVRHERISEFKGATKSIVKACKTFPGFLGARLIEPEDPQADRVVVFRFNSYEDFSRWENSDERLKCVAIMSELVEGEVTREQISGVDYWMTPGKSWPPSWRMVVVVYLAIFPLTNYIPPEIRPLLAESPFLATALSTAMVTLVMSYVSLPLMVLVFKKWLR